MKLLFVLAVVMAFIVTVESGFCDSKYISGSYCDSKVEKQCSCKRKKGSKKVKCDKAGERLCRYGCSGGYCQLPPTPKPAHMTCATTKLGSPYTDKCPILKQYNVWKNYQQTKALLDEKIEDVSTWFSWWDSLRLRMVENNNDTLAFCDDGTNATCTKQFNNSFPSVTKAWTDNQCNTKRQTWECRYSFPACKADKGDNVACIAACKQMDGCLSKIYDACMAVAQANPNNNKMNITANGTTTEITTLSCSKYIDTITEEEKKKYTKDGVRNCQYMCEKQQNDASDASVLQTSMVFAIFPVLYVVFQ
jgi:hypothetical protein